VFTMMVYVMGILYAALYRAETCRLECVFNNKLDVFDCKNLHFVYDTLLLSYLRLLQFMQLHGAAEKLLVFQSVCQTNL